MNSWGKVITSLDFDNASFKSKNGFSSQFGKISVLTDNKAEEISGTDEYCIWKSEQSGFKMENDIFEDYMEIDFTSSHSFLRNMCYSKLS